MEELDFYRTAGIEPTLVAGLRLLSVDQVRGLLFTAERQGWVIWGLDGFEVVDGGVQPDMDQIADWSALREDCRDISARSIAATRGFLDIAARGDRLYGVVISDEN